MTMKEFGPRGAPPLDPLMRGDTQHDRLPVVVNPAPPAEENLAWRRFKNITSAANLVAVVMDFYRPQTKFGAR